jgi:C1A family cysteine protease
MQPVKDQGQCGSCYAFSAVSVLEYHAGVSISEQKIIDCSSSTNGPSYGCDGGWPENIFEYAKNSPVVLEKDQPYQQKNLPCNQTCEGSVIRVKRYGSVDQEKDEDSETRIPYILNTHGPVSVAIDVGTTELLMSYQNGTFPGVACGAEPDHAVTIVGYTPDYWIVRNSWSQDWGDDGYFYLERDVNACGVGTYISYVSKIQ